jgi:ATP-binding protein involved in chromosome partitioning
LIRPEQVVLFPSGDLGIRWADGHEQIVPARALRLQCPCAVCVDEHSGKRLLDPRSVPATIRPSRFHWVGNYALQFEWSDGHSTGLFSFDFLRRFEWTP